MGFSRQEYWSGLPLPSPGDLSNPGIEVVSYGNTGTSFLTTQGKDPSSRAKRRKRGSSGCGRDSGASSRVETGVSGNFLSCSKGLKDLLEIPDVRFY